MRLNETKERKKTCWYLQKKKRLLTTAKRRKSFCVGWGLLRQARTNDKRISKNRWTNKRWRGGVLEFGCWQTQKGTLIELWTVRMVCAGKKGDLMPVTKFWSLKGAWRLSRGSWTLNLSNPGGRRRLSLTLDKTSLAHHPLSDYLKLWRHLTLDVFAHKHTLPCDRRPPPPCCCANKINTRLDGGRRGTRFFHTFCSHWRFNLLPSILGSFVRSFLVFFNFHPTPSPPNNQQLSPTSITAHSRHSIRTGTSTSSSCSKGAPQYMSSDSTPCLREAEMSWAWGKWEDKEEHEKDKGEKTGFRKKE